MTPRLDGWSIVLAGHWNRMIFTPEWVNQHLFHQDAIETLVAILPVFPLIYQVELVKMEVSQPRVIFRPRAANDESLRRAEEMAHIVLEKLDDTPLTGVGINFHFVEEAPPARITDIFNNRDNTVLAENGWEIRERRILRQLVKSDTILNLNVAFLNGTVTFEFNFHAETVSNEAARNAVSNRAITLRDLAIEVLRDVYELQCENEGGHHD